jgi:hypothetical protein
MRNPAFFLAVPIAIVITLGVWSCSKSDDAKKSAPPAASNLPDSFWLKTAPADAKPVAEVRANAKTGDKVVVTGFVGGSTEPFTGGAAALTLVDASVKACTEDHCPTPWDYCCEPVENLRKNMVTIEFREKGTLLKTSARGFHGLDHSKKAVVAGEAKRDEAGNVVVIANGVYITP